MYMRLEAYSDMLTSPYICMLYSKEFHIIPFFTSRTSTPCEISELRQVDHILRKIAEKTAIWSG